MTASPVVRAAGGVVWRLGSRGTEVLLVHRPRHGDWSFPKGKLDPDETATTAAAREVLEETGLGVGLGPRLPDQHYTLVGGQPKVVHYWAARAPKDADIGDYQPNEEIDGLTWVGVNEAPGKLSYSHDVDLLAAFTVSGFDSSPLLIVRHAQALSRGAWRGDDTDRPLHADGRAQALRLEPLLRAYGVARVVSSDAARCVETVLPYVDDSGSELRLSTALSQHAIDPVGLSTEVLCALRSKHPMAMCSHRPLLPAVFAAAGVDPIGLAPGAVVVLHRKDGKVIDMEQH